MDKLKHFAKDESAVTAIEYAIIGGVIGLMLVAVVPGLRGPLEAIFEALDAGFDEVAPS